MCEGERVCERVCVCACVREPGLGERGEEVWE